MLPFINPAPLLFTLATMFGVVVHDTHIDRATTIAVAIPAIVASAGALDKVINASDHTHVERVAFSKHNAPLRAALPKVQPRDDDRRYIVQKKVFLSGGNDRSYLWPSV